MNEQFRNLAIMAWKAMVRDMVRQDPRMHVIGICSHRKLEGILPSLALPFVGGSNPQATERHMINFLGSQKLYFYCLGYLANHARPAIAAAKAEIDVPAGSPVRRQKRASEETLQDLEARVTATFDQVFLSETAELGDRTEPMAIIIIHGPNVKNWTSNVIGCLAKGLEVALESFHQEEGIVLAGGQLRMDSCGVAVVVTEKRCE